MVSAAAQMGMAYTLSGPWSPVLTLGQVHRAKFGYALSIARHASEVQHWAAVIALACDDWER